MATTTMTRLELIYDKARNLIVPKTDIDEQLLTHVSGGLIGVIPAYWRNRVRVVVEAHGWEYSIENGTEMPNGEDAAK
jgi:hypothetical protein